MELKDYFRLLRRRWWIVALCVVLGGAGSYLATERETKVYGSSLTFFLSDGAGRPVSTLVAQSAQTRFTSYITLTSSAPVVRQVEAEAGGGVPILGVFAAGIPNTIFMTVSVKSTSPAQAQRLAVAYGRVFPTYVTQFERAGANGDGTTLRLLEPPSTSLTPLSPNMKKNVLIGLVLGLVLGLATALLLEALDGRVRTPEELETETGFGLLATVPLEHRKQALVVHTRPRSRRAEAIRQVRANLQFAELERSLRVVVVTSAVAGEGKTSVATNLALACAETGQRVVLVDGDLRKPRVAEVFGMASEPGLSEVLLGRASLDRCLVGWGEGSLHVLPSGRQASNPGEILNSEAMRLLLEDLAQDHDIIIIDSAPLLPVADTVGLLQHTDAVILVSRVRATTRRQVKQVAERLQSFHARVLGVVANGTRTSRGDNYYYSDDKSRRLRRPGSLASARSNEQ